MSNYDPGVSGPGVSGFGTTGFGGVNSLGSGSSFHSANPDYYKKALKGSTGINSINSYGGSSYGGAATGNLYGASSNYHESARQDNFDCVCVPYDQCPARDILGRKGDLILPLDPRNLGSDIEAEESNSTTSSNSTVTRVAKQVSPLLPSDSDSDGDESSQPIEVETTKEDVKKITKREAAVDKKSDEFQKSDGEAVSIQGS